MSDHSQRIEQLLRQGRKIEAIKLFSEATGVDLAHAKKEIDRIETTMAAHDRGRVMMTPGDPAADALPDDVLELVRTGKKIEAIKLLRDRTGLGLKEAKDRIDLVDGSKGKGGCAGSIALVASGALLALLMA